jgi:hypothetical protein
MSDHAAEWDRLAVEKSVRPAAHSTAAIQPSLRKIKLVEASETRGTTALVY